MPASGSSAISTRPVGDPMPFVGSSFGSEPSSEARASPRARWRATSTVFVRRSRSGADLARAEIGPVAQRDQLAVSLVEAVRRRSRRSDLSDDVRAEVQAARSRQLLDRHIHAFSLLRGPHRRCSAFAIPIIQAIGDPAEASYELR